MPENAVVFMRYGPYSALGLSVEHRTFRLQGLQDGPVPGPLRGGDLSMSVQFIQIPLKNDVPLQRAVLTADGHQVILEKIDDWNVVELVVNEDVVFRCNINDLEFGGDGKLDPLCEQARIAVLDAY